MGGVCREALLERVQDSKAPSQLYSPDLCFELATLVFVVAVLMELLGTECAFLSVRLMHMPQRCAFGCHGGSGAAFVSWVRSSWYSLGIIHPTGSSV